MESITLFWTILGSNVVAFGMSAGAAYLLRSVIGEWITHHFSKKTIRFESLHTRSAETAAETYARLRRLHSAMSQYSNPITYAVNTFSDNIALEEDEKVQIAFHELQNYVNEQQIFIPPRMVTLVEELQVMLVNKYTTCFPELFKATIWKHYRSDKKEVAEAFGRPFFGDEFDSIIKMDKAPCDPREYMRQFEDDDEKIDELFRELEREFRDLLGFEGKDKS